MKHRLRTAHPMRSEMRRSLLRMEHASAEEIRHFQERRLQRLVRFAALRSPFYRRWFAESGVDPRSIRTLDDLGKLPLLSRADLTTDAESFCTYPRSMMWAAHSSGTSGSVVTTYRTPGSSVYELSALERQWGWFGLSPGARRIVLRGAARLDGEADEIATIVAGAGQMVISSYMLDSVDTDRLLSEARAFGPVAVEGWPSSISLLASLLEERGTTLPLDAVITSSEVMTRPQRDQMRSVFGGPIVDHYGQTERVALAGACEAGGYHVFPDYGIVELLPVPGRHDRWEIVGTSLHNWGFPLFRYHTGDEVGPSPKGPCPCGRSFERIGTIHGRIEGSFVSASGRTLPLPSLVLDDLVGMREAQIAQLAPGRFEIRVVPARGTDVEAVKAKALANVDKYFGTGQKVSFTVLEKLPRLPSGKLKSSVVEHPHLSSQSGS